MRTLLIVAVLLAMVGAPAGAQDRPADQLRKGIAEEEAGQNLDKAIQAYQAIVARYDEDRKTAGTALFRLAECYRKTGRREQAIAAYQRVVREFGDQQATLESSRRQLASLGVAEPREPRLVRPAVATARAPREARTVVSSPEPALASRPSDSFEATKIEISDAGRRLDEAKKRMRDVSTKYNAGSASVEELEAAQDKVKDVETQVKLLEQRLKQQYDDHLLAQRTMLSVDKEIMLVQERIAAIEANVKKGVTSPQDAELLQLRRDLLVLQRKLDDLRIAVR